MPHRWDGTTVVVATDAEASVDELLDAIEQGTLVLTSGAAADGRARGRARRRCSRRRTAWPGTPTTRVGRDELRDLLRSVSPTVAAVRRVDGHVGQDARCGDGARRARRRRRRSSPSDIIGAAQALRALVRQYV